MIGTETAIGLLLSLVSFLRTEVGGRLSKEELLAAIGEQQTVQSYLEWIRRQDQETLVHQIESAKSTLLAEVSSLGLGLNALAEKICLQAGDLEGRLRDLNDRIRPPVLSLQSLPTRPRANVQLKGRETELKWLAECKTDALVSGQPGSGKTELLQSVVAEQRARFLVTTNPEEAVAALLKGAPPVVIIDDAGTKRDLILRLMHLRAESALAFRIVAICWPFDRVTLQQSLQISDAATLQLEGLPRKIIAEIINEIATAQGVKVNDQFIRVVVQQSRGMPGLAASLSMATIAAGGEALISGKILLQDLAQFLTGVAGPDTVRLLSAFACGGKNGISFQAVAEHLGKEILQVMSASERIALAGVLEQTGKETLCVQPDFLRSALLKDTFFSDTGISLPWKICEALITSAQDPVLGYLELIHARGRAGANVPFEMLREITAHVSDSRLWDAMAALDKETCEWVLESAPDLTTEIKKLALHFIPKRIIPILLGNAVHETRPLNSLPETDLSLLDEWITGGWIDAVERRRSVFDAAFAWLKAGGNTKIAFSAVSSSFGLNFRETDSDPADHRTMRLRHAFLPLDAAKAIFEQWSVFLHELSDMGTIPWQEVVAVVDHWRRSDIRHVGSIPEEHEDFLLFSTIQMIGDLIPLLPEDQAALHWIYSSALNLGVLIDPCPVNESFMALYPCEPFDDNWEEAEQRQSNAAEELAIQWKNRAIQDIIDDLTMWEQQAASLETIWTNKISVFAQKLASIRELNQGELGIVISQLSPQVTVPFINTAFAQNSIKQDHLLQALERPEFHGLLLQYTLTGRTPDLYPQLESKIPQWRHLAEVLCRRGDATAEMLKKLLQHPDRNLRGKIALEIFRSEHGIPPALYDQWRRVTIDILIELASRFETHQPYDLVKLFASDPTIGPAVLDGILTSGAQIFCSFHGRLMSQLIDPLEKEDRRALLQRCKHLCHSDLPILLVGRDEDLYREFLGIPEYRQCYFKALIGDPTSGNWVALAKIALSAGYSHTEIAYAVNQGGYSWTGGLSSYFQQWVERFERLRQNPDPDIQRIADEGLKWSTAHRDAERRKEKREEIYGWD